MHYERVRKHGDINANKREGIIDLTGQIFNRLTVIGFSHKIGRKSYFDCMCKCGVNTKVRSDSLKNGLIKSCGCLKVEANKHYMTDKERFFSKVAKTNSCWVFAELNSHGYGQFATRVNGKCRNNLAHRYMYEMYHELTIDKESYICHTCDNPACVNPEHLFLGDAQANMADKVAKNRQAKGEGVAASKLTESQVLDIRKRQSEGVQMKYLSEVYNVSKTTISHICGNKTWRYLCQH